MKYELYANYRVLLLHINKKYAFINNCIVRMTFSKLILLEK